MRYLKTYEYFYEAPVDSKDIILRAGTNVIYRDETEKLLSKLNFNFEDIPIYRGMRISKHPSECFIIDPEKHVRKSAYTYNYYTQIIDNLESWKDFPKRSSSLICTTNKQETIPYGQSYRVIPLNKNSKWGVCPNYDLWWSFKEIKKIGIRDMDEFNINLQSVYYDIFNQKLNAEEYFMDSIKKMYKSLSGRPRFQFKKPIPKTFEKLCDAFDPKKNGFISCQYEDLNHVLWDVEKDDVANVELWTNSKSLLIPIDYYDIKKENDSYTLLPK